jgi:hypothetical protein
VVVVVEAEEVAVVQLSALNLHNLRGAAAAVDLDLANSWAFCYWGLERPKAKTLLHFYSTYPDSAHLSEATLRNCLYLFYSDQTCSSYLARSDCLAIGFDCHSEIWTCGDLRRGFVPCPNRCLNRYRTRES